MTVAIIVALALVAVWVLLSLKMSRADGTFVEGVHPYRRMLGFLMPTRAESVVYFDDYVNAEPLLDYLAETKGDFAPNVTHCLVGALNVGLRENPHMNRFVVGRRLYARKERWITFSMKRKKLDAKSKVSTVKMRVDGDVPFRDLVSQINEKIDVERADTKTYTDRELDLFLRLPRPLLSLGVRLLRWFDYHNLLPAGFIDGDPDVHERLHRQLGQPRHGRWVPSSV